jgi:hypothetical protein
MRRWMPALALGAGVLALASQAHAGGPSAPRLQVTVTGTPPGPMIVVPDMVNVRSGPGVHYDQVGVLIQGQTAPAIGRSPGGDWIQIIYPGVPGNTAWVYAPFVRLDASPGLLPIVEPPATPTPRITATIDPTLAAQFLDLGVPSPTRPPTFTPAAPVVYPTLGPASPEPQAGFPPILAILGLFVVGLFGTLISVLRGG